MPTNTQRRCAAGRVQRTTIRRGTQRGGQGYTLRSAAPAGLFYKEE